MARADSTGLSQAEPVPVSSASGFDPSRELIRACIAWSFHSIGEGFIVPEEAFWAYSSATGDEDWETLADRVAAA